MDINDLEDKNKDVLEIAKNVLLLILAIWSIVQIYISVYERIVKLEEQQKAVMVHLKDIKTGMIEIRNDIKKMQDNIDDLEYNALLIRKQNHK